MDEVGWRQRWDWNALAYPLFVAAGLQLAVFVFDHCIGRAAGLQLAGLQLAVFVLDHRVGRVAGLGRGVERYHLQRAKQNTLMAVLCR